MRLGSCYNHNMYISGGKIDYIKRRVRACDYLSVAQLFLQDNFLLEHILSKEDVKPRLLGHWGTCHGINLAYANLQAFFDRSLEFNQDEKLAERKVQKARPADLAVRELKKTVPNLQPKKKIDFDRYFTFVLGPGHGFPALQANLFIDGILEEVDAQATRTEEGIAYVCKQFSWPGGFPSHASPLTPGVICEGGELGYALGAAYGYALGHPEKTIAVLLGDGEFETATALGSMNLVKLVADRTVHGRVLPILHLNGYKISAPTVYARKSERELHELIRGFGFTPLTVNGDHIQEFQQALEKATIIDHPFIIMRTTKGETGPTEIDGEKVAGNFLAHQIPLKEAKTNPKQLKMLEQWLSSYNFNELFHTEKGFTL